MNILENKLWLSDLDEIILVLPELDELAGHSVMITGCTGLICSALVDVLIRWNETHSKKITIFAAAREKKKVDKCFLPYTNREWFSFVKYDALLTDNQLPLSCDYIIHGASNAYPSKIIEEPVETLMSNVLGVKELLDYSRKTGVKRVLYISSSEVYGRRNCNNPCRSDEYGWIDLLNSRNSYSVGKRAAETLCVSYADEYGVEAVIVRPGHIYGPTASENDNRVGSAWAYDAAKGMDIVMKSEGTQIRSYCYCLDSASAMIKAIIKGENAHAYNISNPNSIISVREMAEILTKAAGVYIKNEMPTKEEKKGFNPMDNSSLDSTELINLGWKGLFEPERGFSHTVEILRGQLKKEIERNH